MASHITTDHGGTTALTNKLNVIWKHLKSKACHFVSRYKSRSMPIDAERFLLMCSIFPDEFRIPIDDLVMYGMGLQFFSDGHDMSEARRRVLDIISIINDKKYSRKAIGGNIRLASGTDGIKNQYVEILDGARDLIKSVGSSYPLVLHRETVIGKWPESDFYKDCDGLSLVLKKVSEHLVNLECPRLTLLQLQHREESQSIPVDFFEGMKGLRVLSLDLLSLPQSLDALRNLRTLRLKVPKCEDMSSIGCLVHLEFLSISILSSTEIPREMGQLEKLRLLDLRKMNISYIPPGVLSRLLKLEELYFPLNFIRWGCKAKNSDDYDEWELDQDNYDAEGRINVDISEIDDGERINASLIEIVSLSLNALQICVPKASFLPKKSLVLQNIRDFKILMPNNDLYQPFGKNSSNVLQLTGEACDIKESVCDLLSRAEVLSLTKVRNLTNAIYQLEDYGFPQLKKMIISECDELEYIVDTTKKQIISDGDSLFMQLECLHLSMLSNLKEICHERWRYFQWFSNLSQISIRFCPKLKYVFPLSIVGGLTLKSMEILDCCEMEGIFCADDEDSIPLTFGSVEILDLHSLPKLTGLLVHNDNMIDGVHDDINESSTVKNVSSHMEGSISSPPTSTTTSRAKAQGGVTQQLISNKKVSIIKNKDIMMHSAFPSKLAAKWLRKLKSLKVAFCDLVQVVFLFEENHVASKAFNYLEVLELHGLRNLVHIWFQIPPKTTAFKNLQLLVLSECSSFYLFPYRVAKLLVQLQKVYASRCEKMEEIIALDDENERKERIVLPQLKLLELQHIPNLRIFFSGNYEIELPLLESLNLKQCNKMKSFSYGLMRMPMLECVEVNGSFLLLRKDLNVIIKGVTIPHSFTFEDLKIATKGFSSDNFLGKGGFGGVYKGWIDKKTFKPSITSIGMPIAVKRIKSGSKQGRKEWESEIDVLQQKLHPNLVELLGWCEENLELLVVYEFVPRGTLHDYLSPSDYLSPKFSKMKPLSWGTRIKIAIGAARGVNFLHTGLEKIVIHRDIKPRNILIDDDYNSKISDFGLAVWGPSDGDSHVTTTVTNDRDLTAKLTDFGLARVLNDDTDMTTGVQGTWTHLDPAYLKYGVLSAKSDVYSFGVVLLELMTGLKQFPYFNWPEEQWNLVTKLKQILSQGRMFEDMIDSQMEGQYSWKAVSLTAMLASKCVEDDPESRPTMGEVLEELQKIDAIDKIDAINEKHKERKCNHPFEFLKKFTSF